MRARIMLAFLALVTVALLVAGAVALVLVRANQRTAQQRNIGRVATIFRNAVAAKGGEDFVKQDVQTVIREIAGVDGEAVLVIGPTKDTATGLPMVTGLPKGIPASAIDVTALVTKGQTAPRSYGNTAYVAVRLFQDSTPAGETTIALLFTANENFTSEYYFLIADAVALIGALLLAAFISGRISTRVVAVARASELIAAGDFETRLTVRPHDYPEIAQLDRSINAMAEALARAQEQERNFLLSISHDLRTPLTSIRGYAEAIADGATPDAGRAASIVLSEADRLERLIRDLLDLARLRARQFAMNPTPIDLCASAATAADALRVSFDQTAIVLETELPPAPVAVQADPDRVAQIIANLLENALKYAARRVTISVTTTAGTAALAVEDDGPGIDPEDLPRVLEPLFTSNRYPARSAGTGLGLAIVAALAGAMGGEVEVGSPVSGEGGTRTTVRLPLAARGIDSDG